MPRYGKTSKTRLAQCHQDLQVIFNEVIKYTDVSIVCGHRTEQEQTVAFENGLSEVQYPYSKHNHWPSFAVDVAPFCGEINGIDWKDSNSFSRLAGVVDIVSKQLLDERKINHRIRWGGDWDSDGRSIDQTFNDLPHFELIPLSV